MGATAAIGAVAGGSALSAYGKYQSGKDAKKMYERNADFAEWQADDAILRGQINERRQRQATEGVIGSQRTSFAAQNVDVNRGSALDVQADSAYLGELDALTIRSNAAKEAFGYQTQASDLIERGKIAKQEGEMGALTSIIGGGSSLLLAKYGGGPYTLTSPGLGSSSRGVSAGVSGTGYR